MHRLSDIDDNNENIMNNMADKIYPDCDIAYGKPSNPAPNTVFDKFMVDESMDDPSLFIMMLLSVI